MHALDKTAWEILNATADDCENLEGIYRQVCYELINTFGSMDTCAYVYRPLEGAPSLSELADRLCQLVEQGLLAVAIDEKGRPRQSSDDRSYVWREWFSMTPQGRSVWESSDNSVEEEQRR
jgi:hypothetical protein